MNNFKTTYFKCRLCGKNYTTDNGACTECENVFEIGDETSILINSIGDGAMIAYEGATHTVLKKGLIIGNVFGRDVYLFGQPPIGYTPAQLIVMCTPEIKKLGNEFASYVTYSSLPKRKKSNQLEMFLFLDGDDDGDDDDDDGDSDGYDGDDDDDDDDDA